MSMGKRPLLTLLQKGALCVQENPEKKSPAPMASHPRMPLGKERSTWHLIPVPPGATLFTCSSEPRRPVQHLSRVAVNPAARCNASHL